MQAGMGGLDHQDQCGTWPSSPPHALSWMGGREGGLIAAACSCPVPPYDQSINRHHTAAAEGDWPTMHLQPACFPSPLPAGMGKRRNNSTRYDHRAQKISWRVEWHFAAADVRCVDERLDEAAVLADALGRHVQYAPGAAERHHALREYADAGADALTVLMRKERVPVSEGGIALHACVHVHARSYAGAQLSMRTPSVLWRGTCPLGCLQASLR